MKKRLKLVGNDLLISLIKIANSNYRDGNPIVSDYVYDALIDELKRRDPDNEFLNNVEPENYGVFGQKTVKLPERMLSTDKAYNIESVERWVSRVKKSAASIGVDEKSLLMKVTPKLDGFAAYYDGNKLYTRGNGIKGTDITHVFDRGLKVGGNQKNEQSFGAGEIVISRHYFRERLSKKFENSRNALSSVIKEGDLDDDIKFAIESGAILFCPFSGIKKILVTPKELIESFEKIKNDILCDVGFDTDGIVIECVNDAIKKEMGHTSHHHRWQIAFKENTEYRDIKVISVTPQTSKTGRITPVAELEPTRVSGAEIRRATCHHYGNLVEHGIGEGAIVRVCRSGLVIPYIEKVIKKSENVIVPKTCPSCGERTKMVGDDNLFCTNTASCPAQIEGTIEYWFKTIGNCDGFGPSVISKLVKSGYKKVADIYEMSASDFKSAGISAGIAENLIGQLNRSKSEEIEDWRFLAAFSINNVGKGGCEKLLMHHKILDIFDLDIDDIVKIDGFAVKTATELKRSLCRIKIDFHRLYGMGFNISTTSLNDSAANGHKMHGKVVVFTGKMESGSRDDMKKMAKNVGAIVAGSVTGKTNYLVCGKNVGKSKINAAKAKGVTVISENEYLKML